MVNASHQYAGIHTVGFLTVLMRSMTLRGSGAGIFAAPRLCRLSGKMDVHRASAIILKSVQPFHQLNRYIFRSDEKNQFTVM